MTIEMIFYIIDKEVNEMKQYLDMCQYILENGQDRDDRTGTGTRSVFGYQTRYDLTDGFPLINHNNSSAIGLKNIFFVVNKGKPARKS